MITGSLLAAANGASQARDERPVTIPRVVQHRGSGVISAASHRSRAGAGIVAAWAFGARHRRSHPRLAGRSASPSGPRRTELRPNRTVTLDRLTGALAPPC